MRSEMSICVNFADVNESLRFASFDVPIPGLGRAVRTSSTALWNGLDASDWLPAVLLPRRHGVVCC